MINERTLLLLKWLGKEKKVIYNIYGLAIIQGALYISIPLTIQGIITYIMAGRFSASLVLLSTLTVLASLFIGLLQLYQMRLNETLHERIFCDLTVRITKVDSEKEGVKEKLSHFFEIVTLQKGIGKLLLELSFSVISILFGLLLLPAYSNWFLVFSVVLGVAFFLIVSYYGRKAQDAHIKTSSRKYAIFNSLLKQGGLDENGTEAQLESYLNYRKSYYRTFENQYKGILIFKICFIAVLLFLGAYLVQDGTLNIGQFVASEIIVLLVINSVEKLVGSLDTCYDMVTAIYKIDQLFTDKPEYSVLNAKLPEHSRIKETVFRHYYSRKVKWLLRGMLITGIVILFLPWTQSVNLNGEVSVLNPENKPQQVTSRIAGRIEKWFIHDGDLVKKNDTIAFISEIKEEYLDTMLVERSESQVRSKEVSKFAYERKVDAINEQIDALNKSLLLKKEQVKNKILQVKAKLSSDSVEALASHNNYKVAEEQMKRFDELLLKGVISKTDLENRRVKVQEAFSKKINAENKVSATKNELLNAELELNTTLQEYNEKLMKAESDKFSTISLLYDAEGSLTKLQNQLSNYALRKNYYYVLAPQDGYVNNIAVKGVGEIVKEGGIICNIVPVQKEQAVELYLSPMDLPLIREGQQVQLVFDGWPAFVFSGWPGISYGSYHATVVSYDKVISPNGKFRVLAVNKGEKWPDAIQIGGGVKGFALLGNVPVIYELWRNINGFPPEYYTQKNTTNEKGK